MTSLLPVLTLGLFSAVLCGCAGSQYQLSLMPRTSGKLYHGVAVNTAADREANVTITIEDKVYNGTWVQTATDRSTGFIAGGFGIGGGFRRGGIGFGNTVVLDHPEGGEAKALLHTADGAGLRCDFRGLGATRNGGGTCQDDGGVVYDVQIRLKEDK
jgi:hypothetical protein